VVLRFRSNLLYQKFVRISTSVSRALKRLCASHRASAEAEVRENALHTTQSFKKDVACRNTNMDSVLRNYFAGGRIRKTETKVFEIRRDSGFRPAGECGRNAGRVSFWIFGEEAFSY
jgi:hypothetical protein